MNTARAQRIGLQIRGMHCGGCVASVEGALRAINGVDAARVNLATQQALVETRDHLETDVLIQAVQAAGFDAAPQIDPHTRLLQRQAERRRDDRSARARIALGLLLGLPALALHFRGSGHTLGPTALLEGLLTTCVVVITGWPMFADAWQAARHRRTSMDTLVALGSGTALLLGWTGVLLQQPAWLLFHAATMIVLFVAIGRYLESTARHRAAAALEQLSRHLPQDARRVTDDGEETVPIDWVVPGDRIRLTPQTLVPVDGELLEGSLAIDESLLTGEPLPRQRGRGATVCAGTTVVEGDGLLRATASGADSTAARIVALVEQAQSDKPPWQRLADRAAAIFVPAVLLLTLITLAGWLLAGAGTHWAVGRALAVLVVACPCALGLAVPTAILVGTGRAAERGILFRSGVALETLATVNAVVWDKTGTLTLGHPQVTDTHALPGLAAEQIGRQAAAVARTSSHPLARAIVAAHGRGAPPAGELEVIPGAGISGLVEGQRVRVGSRAWLAQDGITFDAQADADETRSWIAVGSRPAGWIAFDDPLHEGAADAIAKLADRGIASELLSGDVASVVGRVASQLGIAHWQAGMSPDDKLAHVRGRVTAGDQVAMVGDGINDAPALAAARVGIAMASGADLALAAADVCITSGTPRSIPEAHRIARATSRIIRQNLAWAVGYNLAMLPLAIFTGLPPGLAAGAMMLSSFSVVGNALRLRR